MAEPKGYKVNLPHRRYRLEPGNGTRYEFSITWLAVPREDLGKVVSGVSNGPYVTVTIHDYTQPGTYEFMMHGLTDFRNMGYYINKMPAARKSDVVAIMLAVSVLAHSPNRIEEACQEMMRAPEVMEEIGL